MKALLLGLLLASPPVAAWVFHENKATVPGPPIQQIAQGNPNMNGNEVTKVPVEIVSNGRAPQWIYVQVQADAIPEPGILPLTYLAALLLLRRKRSGS